MHTAQILRRSEDLPVLIEMVDQEEKNRRVPPGVGRDDGR
jgi:PII-like signaling protein